MVFTSIAWAFVKSNWKLIVISAAVLAVFSYHKIQVGKAKRAGYASAIADVNAAAEKLNVQADKGTKTVAECFAKGEPWIWNRSTGKCVKP